MNSHDSLEGFRVTKELIDSIIVSEHYISAYDAVVASSDLAEEASDSLKTVTLCILVLKNKFVVIGEAYDNFGDENREEGKRIAKENAIKKIYPVLNYGVRSLMTSIKD